MTLQTVVPALLLEIPELEAACKKELDYYGDETPDAYPVFSIVLRPATYAALDRSDDSSIKRYFAFYERVAADPDEDVSSLSHIELIEQLANEPARLEQAWPYMGVRLRDQARNYANESRRQFGKQVWLPG